MTSTIETTQVYRVFIKATPQAIWDAITKPEWTAKYGYGGRNEYDPDLSTGATYRTLADPDMQAAGMPAVVIKGEVVEADPPRKLILSWQAQWEPMEGFTRLTYEIAPHAEGVTALTVTHDLGQAPGVAAMVGGQVEGAGGGWAEVLSDLKTLLETGKSMHA